MENIVAGITVLAVIGIPIAIIIMRIVHLKNKWTHSVDGIKVDLSELGGRERIRASMLISTAVGILRQEADRHAALDGLDYGIHIGPGNVPVRPGVGGTAYIHKDWPWSKKMWVVHVTYGNSAKGTWWYDYIPHEIFAHLAYLHEDGSTDNRDHKDEKWLPVELAAKKRMREMFGA